MTTPATTPRAQHNPGLAVMFILTASALVAGTTLLAKALGTGALGPALHPLHISFGRFFFAFLVIASFAALTRFRPRAPALRLHAIRSGFGWGGVSLMFAAASFIPLSDATAISFLNPVFAMLLAIPLLGEKVGLWRWLAALLALLGALILTRPGADGIALGAVLALLAALMMAAEVIAIKHLADREPPLQILLINNAFGLLIATAAASLVWQAPNGAQWLALAGIGGLMAATQACYVNAMARADASFVAPLFFAAVVFAAVYDALWFTVIPDAASVTGAAIVLTGVALLAWRETKRKPNR